MPHCTGINMLQSLLNSGQGALTSETCPDCGVALACDLSTGRK